MKLVPKPALSRGAFALSLAVALSACGSDDDDSSMADGADPGASRFTPVYAAIDCAQLAPQGLIDAGLFGPEGDRAECGQVTVPTDWSVPDGDTLDLAVYRVPSTATVPATDPIVYLEGGPGGAGVVQLSTFFDDGPGGAGFLRQRSDVYVIDQRGTGYSSPALYCPELVTAEREDGDATEAWTACRDRFVAEGVDFADYTSANNARDIDAVRAALGLERWNLYGTSYGTRLALTMMRDVPDGIDGVVLDSVFPPQINGIAEAAYPSYWAIEQIQINCTADADCNANVGDIRALIETGVARLDANPVTVADEPFGAGDYIALLGQSIARPELPGVIEAAATADDATLSALLVEVGSDDGGDTEDTPAPDMPGGEGGPDDTGGNEQAGEGDGLPALDSVAPELYPFVADNADGMYAAVVCAEEVPFPDDTASPDIAGTFSQTLQRVVTEASLDEDLLIACQVLGVPPADRIEVAAVTSPIPALVLAGTADIATPPTWSMLAAESLPNARYVEFAGLSHVVLGDNACLNAITTAFLDAPTDVLDQACIVDLPGVDYDTE